MVGRTNDPAGVEQGLLPRTFQEIFAIQTRDRGTYTFETTIQVAELYVLEGLRWKGFREEKRREEERPTVPLCVM